MSFTGNDLLGVRIRPNREEIGMVDKEMIFRYGFWRDRSLVTRGGEEEVDIMLRRNELLDCWGGDCSREASSRCGGGVFLLR
jgi:hypothetical protein